MTYDADGNIKTLQRRQQCSGESVICVKRMESVSALPLEGATVMPATLSKTDVLKAVETLPDGPLTLRDIIEHLSKLPQQEGSPSEEPVEAAAQPVFGSGKGWFKVADDFDAPLP